jgi:Tfp pilus assembly protein FimT
VFVMGLLAVLTAMAIPQASVSIDRSRATAGARYLAARMALARATAVSRSATVGLRFEDSANGPTFTVFVDGNQNGVRAKDIAALIDRPLEATVRLW